MNWRILSGATLLAIASALAASGQSSSPSFDCSKADGEIETLICKDAGLAALDRKMAGVYEKAMKNWPANIASEQKAIQRGWVKGRNECWKADDKRACVEDSYRTRIVELQIQSGQLMVPNPVGYLCEGEATPLMVTFYGETDPASAVITIGNDQVIALLDPSGSGARYTAANVALQRQNGEVTLHWFDRKLQCEALK